MTRMAHLLSSIVSEPGGCAVDHCWAWTSKGGNSRSRNDPLHPCSGTREAGVPWLIFIPRNRTRSPLAKSGGFCQCSGGSDDAAPMRGGLQWLAVKCAATITISLSK